MKVKTPEGLVDVKTYEDLDRVYGYIPSGDPQEKFCVVNDTLIVAHPDRLVRQYASGCSGSYTEIRLTEPDSNTKVEFYQQRQWFNEKEAP